MPDVVLATANARFSHASLGLRSLLANLGGLASRAELLEFTVDERPADVAERILDRAPAVVGLGVYIWNLELLTAVVGVLKQVRPDLRLVLGGPEVSYAADRPPICDRADLVIAGEAELALPGALERLLGASDGPERRIDAPPPELDRLALPYHLYDEQDVAHRVIYVEASRGCPHRCEFCLSSLDRRVRRFPPARLLAALDELWNRGVRRFKFTDRALDLAVSAELLDFFLDRADPALFVHFELIPDRLPGPLLDRLARFPRGAVQLEAGVQSLDPEVTARIGRRQDPERALGTIARLVGETGVHLHADLLIGLPGEGISGLRASFDRLLATGCHELQLGLLKRLRGAPISRHDAKWGMVYRDRPPYDVLQTAKIDFQTMQRLGRLARYFDLVFNSGNFVETAPLLSAGDSAFVGWLTFADWLYDRTGQTAGIALHRLAEQLFEHLHGPRKLSPNEVANRLAADFARVPGRRLPRTIARHVTSAPARTDPSAIAPLPKRQRRR